MRAIIIALFLAALPSCYACGNSTTDSEVTAQVKKVIRRTPLVCPDYVEVDVSLGVMRNGIGSMSHEDMKLRLMDESQVPALEKAAKDGAIVTLRYDEARMYMCYPERKLKSWQVDIDPAVPTDAGVSNGR
jgi:hypothetical protein